MTAVAQRWSAAVDWITATAQGPDAAAELERLGTDLLHQQREAGNDPTEWSNHGFVGMHCGQVTSASSPNAALIQCTGALAADHFFPIMALAENVSRLDIQVTAWRALSDKSDLAAEAFATATRVSKDRGKTLTCQLITGYPDGATVYLGAPKSDKRARLYDKYAEGHEAAYAGAWRYELQLRRRPAWWMANYLVESYPVASSIARAVYGHWSDRGVEPIFAPGGQPWTGRTPAPDTDDQRRLRWLHDQVRPVLRKLQQRHPAATVLQALGLQAPGTGVTRPDS
jgi:hypothetical protein